MAGSLTLSCAQLCQCVLSRPVANPNSKSAAPNRPTEMQRQQRGLDHSNPGLLPAVHASLFTLISFWIRSLATVGCTFCQPHLPKVLFLKCKPSSRYSPVRPLFAAFPDRRADTRTCGNKHPTSATPEATWPQKPQGFAPECLHPYTHALPNCYYCSHTRTAFAAYVVDMLTRLPPDIRP